MLKSENMHVVPKKRRTKAPTVPEATLLADIRLTYSRGGIRLYRNNSGALQDKRGRWVQFGLAPGSGDLIGWRSVTITPEMVGLRMAQFVSLEVKRPGGRGTEAQRNWREAVVAAGGVGVEVRSVEEAEAALRH